VLFAKKKEIDINLNQGEYFNMILNLKEQFSKNLKLTFLQM
jgi:hypothetical protein